MRILAIALEETDVPLTDLVFRDEDVLVDSPIPLGTNIDLVGLLLRRTVRKVGNARKGMLLVRKVTVVHFQAKGTGLGTPSIFGMVADITPIA